MYRPQEGERLDKDIALTRDAIKASRGGCTLYVSNLRSPFYGDIRPPPKLERNGSLPGRENSERLKILYFPTWCKNQAEFEPMFFAKSLIRTFLDFLDRSPSPSDAWADRSPALGAPQLPSFHLGRSVVR